MRRKKHKHRHWLRNRILVITSIFLIVFTNWIHSLNVYLEPRLHAVAKQNVIFAINSVTQSVLKELEYDPNTLIQVNKNKDDTISTIEYDSYRLNQILYTALSTIEKNFNGSDEDRSYEKDEAFFFKNGAIYECPIGYLTKIPFLSNTGPRMPIHIHMLNDVTGEIKVTSQEYGLNNTMIKASMKIAVKTQVLTILSTSEMETSTEIPIILQVVQGKIPQIAPYYGKSTISS